LLADLLPTLLPSISVLLPLQEMLLFTVAVFAATELLHHWLSRLMHDLFQLSQALQPHVLTQPAMYIQLPLA
jgi:hypothetical protein